ncbi:MAG: hypothetical protein [Virus sp.]|nr:MAG: hypothetical protein [Virus sp.]
MAKRKAKQRRRSNGGIRVLNVLESLTYAEIISRGTTGGGLGQLIFGETDLGMKQIGIKTQFYDNTEMVAVGEGQISLGDIVSQPSQAIAVMTSNFQKNLMPMAVAGFTTSIGFRVGRSLLRRPISNINRNLMRPLFGKSVRL